jgi:hypothetical protein
MPVKKYISYEDAKGQALDEYKSDLRERGYAYGEAFPDPSTEDLVKRNVPNTYLPKTKPGGVPSSTAKGASGFLYDFDEPEAGHLRFTVEGDISDNKTINWAAQDVLGRANPIFGYTSSGPRGINLTLIFIAHSDAEFDVVSSVDFCKSFLYPDYSKAGEVINPPHMIRLVYSNINIIGIVTAADVTWSTLESRPIKGGSRDGKTALMKATVSMSISSVYEAKVPDLYVIREKSDGYYEDYGKRATAPPPSNRFNRGGGG